MTIEQKLELAIKTIIDSLTTVWEDNGNIMSEAVRDRVLTNLSKLTGFDIESLDNKIEELILERQ